MVNIFKNLDDLTSEINDFIYFSVTWDSLVTSTPSRIA